MNVFPTSSKLSFFSFTDNRFSGQAKFCFLAKMVIKVIPYEILTHKRLVISLYKRAMRNLQDHFPIAHHLRYHQVLLRARFDENKSIADPVKAKQLLSSGEMELWQNRHYQPSPWFDSPDGIAYERELHLPDFLVDYWHPIEKKMYPEYFARREQRKKEYVEWYEKKYGKPTAEDLHH